MILGKRFSNCKIHYLSKLQARREHACHTPEQMQMIIDAAPELFKTLFAVAAETGMRSGELYGLRVEDVDFKRLLIFVRRSVWDGKEQSTKSENADRVIDIQQQLAALALRLETRSCGICGVVPTVGHSSLEPEHLCAIRTLSSGFSIRCLKS